MEGKEKSSGSNLNSKWLGAKGLSTWPEACREDRGHVRMQERRGPMWGWEPARRGFLTPGMGWGTLCEGRSDNTCRALSPASATGQLSVPMTNCVPSPELLGEASRGYALAGEPGFPEEPGASSGHPPHPICLTWEMMLGPEHEGDARLGSGFKVATELSGLGTEDGGEAVVLTVDAGREGGAFTEAARCSSTGQSERGWVWLPQSSLPHCWVSSGHQAPPPTRATPGQSGGICISGGQSLHPTCKSLMVEYETLKVIPRGEYAPQQRGWG